MKVETFLKLINTVFNNLDENIRYQIDIRRSKDYSQV